MTKCRTLIIFLLFLFFIVLNGVSAADNSTVQLDAAECENLQSGLTDDVLFEDEGDILGDNEIIVHEGDSIQSAIDSAKSGDTIIVEKGTYSEDLVISKEISIKGQNAILNSDKLAFMILPTANNTSISGFNIVIGNVDGNGIYVNSSGCRIENNRITGGNIGILTDDYVSNKSGEIEIKAINNLSIVGNTFRDMGGAGISVNAFNPTVSRNKVSNIANDRKNGTAIGIRVNGIGIIPDDLKVTVTDNHISHIKSLYNDSYGLDVGGNSIFDTLGEFNVFNNTVEYVSAGTEAYGMNIGVFALNTTLPTVNVHDLKVSHVSAGSNENASVTGLSVSATTIGQNDTSDVLIHDVSISHLDAMGSNSKVVGITTTGVGCVDIYVFDSELKDFIASDSVKGISATGIEYLNFNAFISVSDNNVSDFKASKIEGIYVMSLGNAEINKNLLHDFSSADSTFITGICLSIKFDGNSTGFNTTSHDIREIIRELEGYLNNTNYTVEGNLTVRGNNLEGTGTGFAIVRPSKINYNRAVNLKYNVVKESTRTFILESYGYDSNMSNEELAYLLLKAMDGSENYTEEELRNMSVSLGAFIDKFFGDFDNSTAGDVDARFNWWGHNSRPDDSKFKSNNGNIIYDPWLILRVRSNPGVIKKGQFSKITADVYMDSRGRDHSANARLFFSGPRVTLSTDLGSFNGKKSITLNWTNGKASAYLKGDREGLANVSASDYETVNTTVLIGNKNYPSSDNTTDVLDGEKNIETLSDEIMPVCGNPIALLVIVMLFNCIGFFRRK